MGLLNMVILEENFGLNATGVDHAFQVLDRVIDENNLIHEQKLRLQLGVENILLNWLAIYPHGKTVRLCVSLRFGRYYVDVELTGDEHNPLLDTNGYGLPREYIGVFSGQHSDWDLSATYRYVDGVNTVSVGLPYQYHNLLESKNGLGQAFSRDNLKLVWQKLQARYKSVLSGILALVALYFILSCVGAYLPSPMEEHLTVNNVWGASYSQNRHILIDKSGQRLLVFNTKDELLALDYAGLNEAEPYKFQDAFEHKNKVYALKTYRHQNAFVSEQKIVRYNELGIPEENVFTLDCSQDNLDANVSPILAMFEGGSNDDDIRFLKYNAKLQQLEVYLLEDRQATLLWSCSYDGDIPMFCDYNAKIEQVVVSDYYGRVYRCSAQSKAQRIPIDGVVYFVFNQNGELLYARRGSNALWKYGEHGSQLLVALNPKLHISAINTDLDNYYFSTNDGEDWVWNGKNLQQTQPVPYSNYLYGLLFSYYFSILYLAAWLGYFFYKSLGFLGIGQKIYKYLVPICVLTFCYLVNNILLESSWNRNIQTESSKMQYYARIPLEDGRSVTLGALLEKYNQIDKSRLDMTAVMNPKIPVEALPLAAVDKQTIQDLRAATDYIDKQYRDASKANLNVNDPYLMTNQQGKNTVLYAGDHWRTLFNTEAASYNDKDSQGVLVHKYDDADGSGTAITQVLKGPKSGKVEGVLTTYASYGFFRHLESIFLLSILAKLALYGAVIYIIIQELIHAWENYQRYRQRERYHWTLKEFYFVREIRLFNIILAEADAVLLVLIVKNLLLLGNLPGTFLYISGLLFLKGAGSMGGMACFDYWRKYIPLRKLALGCSLGIVCCYVGMYYAVGADNYWEIVLLRTLVAFFCSFILQALNVLPVYLYNDNMRAETIANNDFGMMAGSIIGPLILGYVGEQFGYADIYLVLVGMGVCGLLVNALCFTPKVCYLENRSDLQVTTMQTVGKFFCIPSILSLCVFFVMPLGLANNYAGFIFPMLASVNLGISDFAINNLVVIGTALTYWLRPIVDIVESRIDFWLESILGLVFCGVSFMALANNKNALYIMLMLVVVGFASKFDNTFFLVLRMIRNRNLYPITYLNLYMALGALLSAGAVYVLGYFMEASYQLTFLLVGILCLLGAGMFTFISSGTVMKE